MHDCCFVFLGSQGFESKFEACNTLLKLEALAVVSKKEVGVGEQAWNPKFR